MVWSTLLWGLAAVGLSLLAILVLILVTPVVLTGVAEVRDKVRFDLRLRVLGDVGPSIPLKSDGSPKKSRKPKSRKRTKRRRSLGRIEPGLGFAVADLLLDWLHKIHVRRFVVDAEFGLGDPADTGVLFGYLAPILYGVPRSETWLLDLRPDFTRATLAGRVEGSLSVRPVSLLPPVAIFAWRLMRGRAQ